MDELNPTVREQEIYEEMPAIKEWWSASSLPISASAASSW